MFFYALNDHQADVRSRLWRGVRGWRIQCQQHGTGPVDCRRLRKEKSPLILQISKGARKYANIRYLKHIIDAAVEEHPELPIAIHCDHGDTLDLIQACINDGYTSVMIDGSHHPYDENVKLTADAVKLAHAAGVVVEAELGMLGGIEEDVVGLDAEEYEKNVEKFLTDPEQAADFCEEDRHRQPRRRDRDEPRGFQIQARGEAGV